VGKRKKKSKEVIRNIPENHTSNKINLLGTLGILFLISVILIAGIKAFNGDFNEVHPYLGNKILEGGFVTQQNPNFPPELDMQVILKTDSLSARNPIRVEAKMFPNENILVYKPDPWPHLPEKQYLMFPSSLQYPVEMNLQGYTKSGFIELSKSENSREYKGTGQIIYETEGEYGFFFTGPKTIKEHQEGDSTSWGISEMQERVIEKSKFPVGSIEKTNSLEMSNYALAGFIIGPLLGLIWKFRKDIIDGVSWLTQFQSPVKNKKKIIIGGSFITAIIVSVILLGYFLVTDESVEIGIIDNTYFNKNLHFEILRPNSDWFFIQEFWHNKERFNISLPNHDVIGGVLIQQTIDEKVSVIVFSGTGDTDLLEFIHNDFSYLDQPGFKDTISATYKTENPKEVEIEGIFHNPFLEIDGIVIKKDNLVYFVYGEIFSENVNQETKEKISNIVDSFRITS